MLGITLGVNAQTVTIDQGGTVSTCSASFYDTGGAGAGYSSGESHIITFEPATPGNVIKVTFNSYEVEGSTYDYLAIYDGPNNTAPLIDTHEGTGDDFYFDGQSFTALNVGGSLTFEFTSDGSVQEAGWDATIECVPPITCPDPSTLSAGTVTTTEADLSWAENGSATAWDIEVVLTGDAPTGVVSYDNVNTNTNYTATGLTPGVIYDFYVRSDCGQDDTDVSTWIGPFSFETDPTCPPPSALSATNITGTTADFSWTENGGATAWDIEVVVSGNTATGVPTFNDVTTNAPFNATGLNSSLTYELYIRSDCGQDDTDVSNWAGPIDFDTECAIVTPPYLQGFTQLLPNCWSNATNGLPSDGPLESGSSSWVTNTMFSGDEDLKVNLWQASKKEWMISPEFDLSSGTFQAELDVAVTDYSDNSSSDVMGSDDEVRLLITDDAGATWTTLETWTVADNLPNTPTTVITDLSAYSGTVQLAIWASEGSVDDTEDYDFHIDNFRVRTPPQDDAGITEITTPDNGFMPTATVPVIINLRNFGLNDLTAVDIEYTVEDITNGGTVATGTFNWTGTLTTGSEELVELITFVSTSLTEYQITATTMLAGDADAANDEIILNATSALIVTTFPYLEDFEDAGAATPGWKTADWDFVTTIDYGGDADHTSGSGYFAGLDDSNTTGGQMFNLYTPYFDLSASSLTAPTLSFWMQNIDNGSSVTNVSPLHIDVWNGMSWDLDVSTISTLTDAWTEYTVPLTSYSTNPDVQVRFRGEGSSSYESDISIDDVKIDDPAGDDAGFTAFISPLQTEFQSVTPINVEGVLSNFGLNNLTTAGWSWTVDFGGSTIATGTGSWSGDLATGAFETIALGTFVGNTAGTYTISATSSLPNGNADGNTFNDTYTKDIQVVSVYTAPYTENFTNGYPATDWTEAGGEFASPTVITGSSSNWTTDDYLNDAGTGNESARFEIWSTNKGWMFSPFIDLGDGSTQFSLDFDLGLTNWSTTAAGALDEDDRFAVVISTDNGITWTEANALVDFDNTHTWSELGEHISLSLNGYTGIIQLGFYAGSAASGGDNNVYVDNVKISTPLGTDAHLADLTVDGTTVTGFDPDTYDYNVELPFGTTIVPTVIGIPLLTSSSVNTVDAPSLPGASTVTVIAEDGITTLVYTVNFTISSTISTDATLADLAVNGVTVIGFDPATMTYDIELAPGTSSVPTVVGTPNHFGAVVVNDDASALPGTTTVTVTAQDGVTELTYTLNLTAPFNNDATLVDLTIDGTTVDGFDPTTFSYNIILPAGTIIVPTVEGVATDSEALVFNTNAAVLPGTTSVFVVAEDGTSTETYNINFDLAVTVGNVENIQVNVFPNPSTGYFTINSEENFDVMIFNISGKIIKRFNTSSVTDFEILTSGVYFMRLVNEKYTITKKLIVK